MKRQITTHAYWSNLFYVLRHPIAGGGGNKEGVDILLKAPKLGVLISGNGYDFFIISLLWGPLIDGGGSTFNK